MVFHLSTGDNFTMYPIILYYLSLYKNIYIFCLYRNKNVVTQLYQNYKNIHIIIINETYNSCIVPCEIIEETKNKLEEYDLFLTGFNDPIWNFEGTTFWRAFYSSFKLPYEIRYNYTNFYRNTEREIQLYNNVINNYGKEYIFVHDHQSINYQHYDIRQNVIIKHNLPIFHPNINYYFNDTEHDYYNLWNNSFSTDNILDYCTLIENATEIHINDSVFSCICPYLNLDKINNKYIYTNINIRDYHTSYNSWNIIY